MKGKKLVFAFILALIVCVALIPLCAYAEGGETDPVVANATIQDSDGTQQDYTSGSVQDLIDKVPETTESVGEEDTQEAASKNVINVTQSTSENITISGGQSLTLNIGEGVTLSNNGDSDTITVLNGGVLYLNGNGTVDNTSNGRSAIWNEGTVYLNGNLTISRSEEASTSASDSGGNSYYVVTNHGALLSINDSVTIKFSESNPGYYSSAIENGYFGGNDTDTNKTTRSWYSGDLNADTVTNAENPKLVINNCNLIYGGKITVKNDNGGVLEINGGTIEQPTSTYFAVYSVSETTINGGVINGPVGCKDGTKSSGSIVINENTNGDDPVITGNVEVGSSFTMNAGTVGGFVATSAENAQATLNGGEVKGQVFSASSKSSISITNTDVGGYVYNGKDGSTIDIYSGTFAKQVDTYYGGTLNIYDGTFNATVDSDSSNGTVNIYGGTFNKGVSSADDAVLSTAGGGTLNIYGGTFNEDVSCVDSAELNITGGTFVNDVSAYTDGTMVAADGKYYAGSAINDLDQSAQAINIDSGDYAFTDAVAGFTVTNNGDGTVTVNGVEVAKGETYTVPESIPDESNVEPSEEPAEETTSEPAEEVAVEESATVLSTTVEATVEGNSTVSLAANEDVVIKLSFTSGDASGAADSSIKVIAVIVNGVEVDFTIAADGSIVLSPEVLAALGPGTHTIYIHTTEGLVKVTITITE